MHASGITTLALGRGLLAQLWDRRIIPRAYVHAFFIFSTSRVRGHCIHVFLVEVEKVQNITVRITQGLLPGTSCSAARGLLGLLSMEVEIEKRKLHFLG